MIEIDENNIDSEAYERLQNCIQTNIFGIGSPQEI